MAKSKQKSRVNFIISLIVMLLSGLVFASLALPILQNTGSLSTITSGANYYTGIEFIQSYMNENAWYTMAYGITLIVTLVIAGINFIIASLQVSGFKIDKRIALLVSILFAIAAILFIIFGFVTASNLSSSLLDVVKFTTSVSYAAYLVTAFAIIQLVLTIIFKRK